MIRFSAGLVVVAIGVLIGGVATSKLSLVYVAIAVSAFALIVLAIGVALKRDELFGSGPELAPAGAGAGSAEALLLLAAICSPCWMVAFSVASSGLRSFMAASRTRAVWAISWLTWLSACNWS